MSKVRCMDCKHWISAGTRTKKRDYMFSFSFAYVTKGTCMNMKCSENTSGYTGDPRGHKMSRMGETRRFCKYFEPKNIT